jgi:hypothetical protein
VWLELFKVFSALNKSLCVVKNKLSSFVCFLTLFYTFTAGIS